MDSVLRGLALYFFLLVVFRVAGRRTLGETSTFDFVLLLIISETTQQAMIDTDNSITNGFLLILTLIGTSILLSLLKVRFPALERLIEGVPVLVIEDGRVHRRRMERLRVDENDIMIVARQSHGLESLDEIKHVVVEPGGQISIIPKRK